MSDTKRCPGCGEVKTKEYFSKDKSRSDGYGCYCKKCNGVKCAEYQQRPEVKKYLKDYGQKPKVKEHQKQWRDSVEGRKCRLKYVYGVSDKVAEQLIKQQDNGVCDICGGRNLSGIRLGVDHNHQTGKIRGVLCIRCNTKVALEEETELVSKIKLYLEKYS